MKKSGRMHERIPLVRMVEITFPNHQCNHPTEDISLAGMFIAGEFKEKPGTPCSITLKEKWSEHLFSMEFASTVTRQETDGIAIQFAEMSQKTSDLLQTVLLYSCDDPLSLGEEFANGCPFSIAEYGFETRNKEYTSCL